MHWKLIRLREASVQKTGAITNRRGEPTGLRVSPGGYMILDEADRVIGTITLAGRVYDRDGLLLTQIERHDLNTPQDDSSERAFELGGALGLY